MMTENSYSGSFSKERRIKFLARKLDEMNSIMEFSGQPDQQQPKIEMFFHKLRGTAATFDFMDLDALSQKAFALKGNFEPLRACFAECKTKIESLKRDLEGGLSITLNA